MIHATEAKQLSRAASSLLFTRLDFETKPNGKYPSEDFQKVLARSAFDGEFVHTTAKELQLARGADIDLQQRSPLAKSLLYHLRHLSPDAIDAQFDGVRAATFAHARRQRAFARPVDVALDIHEWLYTARPRHRTSAQSIQTAERTSPTRSLRSVSLILPFGSRWRGSQ